MAAVVRGVLKGIKEKGLANFLRDVREEGYLCNPEILIGRAFVAGR